MTRDEAIETLRELPNWNSALRLSAALHVDAVVALGLLKLDEPKTVEQGACEALQAALGHTSARIAVFRLRDAGFKIIKDKT